MAETSAHRASVLPRKQRPEDGAMVAASMKGVSIEKYASYLDGAVLPEVQRQSLSKKTNRLLKEIGLRAVRHRLWRCFSKSGHQYHTQIGFTLCCRCIGYRIGGAFLHNGVQDDVYRTPYQIVVESNIGDGFRLKTDPWGRAVGDTALLFLVIFLLADNSTFFIFLTPLFGWKEVVLSD